MFLFFVTNKQIEKKNSYGCVVIDYMCFGACWFWRCKLIYYVFFLLVTFKKVDWVWNVTVCDTHCVSEWLVFRSTAKTKRHRSVLLFFEIYIFFNRNVCIEKNKVHSMRLVRVWSAQEHWRQCRWSSYSSVSGSRMSSYWRSVSSYYWQLSAVSFFIHVISNHGYIRKFNWL